MEKKAVVLVSGGLDSATTLAYANEQGFECHAISFDYNQRHRSELDAAKKVIQHLGAKTHHIIPIGLGNLGGSALTDFSMDVPEYTGSSEIPSTYVPARNTIFLSYALALAEVCGAFDIFYGASHVDYSGYPDCRPEYLAAFQTLANLATKAGIEQNAFKIQAPLMELSKAETIKLGLELGVDYSLTISCYSATDEGFACGKCDSCTLRKKGFEELGTNDPTLYCRQ